MTTPKLFATLNDGKWHKINELSKQFKVKTDKLTEFFLFLSTQGVITYEEKNNRIKVKPEWQNLLPTETEPPSPTKSPSKPDAQKSQIDELAEVALHLLKRLVVLLQLLL